LFSAIPLSFADGMVQNTKSQTLPRAYLEQERFRQAIVHLEEAVRVLPDYKRAAARTYLALALERDGQFERAARVRSELSAQ
jgi:tetratricopeptide (TPR) repeat protein